MSGGPAGIATPSPTGDYSGLVPGNTDDMSASSFNTMKADAAPPLDPNQEQLDKIVSAIDIHTTDEGTPKRGKKAVVERLEKSRTKLEAKVSKGPKLGPEEAPVESPGDLSQGGTSSTLTKLAGRYNPQPIPEGTPTPTYEPYSPKPPPENVQEAQEFDVAEDGKLGGPNSEAARAGFKADLNEVDEKLQGDLGEIARKRGIIAVIQGLGMAASGWYGLHKNVDMSGINFAQPVKFEAEEAAIMERAKFRRKQLVDERKDSIRQMERTEDIDRRSDERTADIDRKSGERAEDIALRTYNRAEDVAREEHQRKFKSVRDVAKEETDTAFEKYKLTQRDFEIGTKRMDISAKAKIARAKLAEKKAGTTKLAPAIDKAEESMMAAAYAETEDIIQGKVEPTYEAKLSAMNSFLAPMIKVYPEHAKEFKALRESALSGELKHEGMWWESDTREVALDKMRDSVQSIIVDKDGKPEPIYFTEVARARHKQVRRQRKADYNNMIQEFARDRGISVTKAKKLYKIDKARRAEQRAAKKDSETK